MDSVCKFYRLVFLITFVVVSQCLKVPLKFRFHVCEFSQSQTLLTLKNETEMAVLLIICSLICQLLIEKITFSNQNKDNCISHGTSLKKINKIREEKLRKGNPLSITDVLPLYSNVLRSTTNVFYFTQKHNEVYMTNIIVVIFFFQRLIIKH